MSLTWRDVAGGGYGGGGGRFHQGNSNQLMEGIRGFNEALDAIVNRKNNRALHDIENQMALNNLDAKHQQSQLAALQNVITAQDKAEDAAAEAEWNRASGVLLKNAHQAGARPEGTPDPFQSDIFLALSPRAQAMGAKLMGEQIIAGREFGSEDEARTETASREGRRVDIAEAEERRRKEEYERLQEASKDPFADVDKASRVRLDAVRNRAAADYARFSGAGYEDYDITKNKDIDSATMWNTWFKVQRKLADEGYGEAPPSVLKRFVAEVGKDSGRAAEEALYNMTLAYHRADQFNSFIADEVASAMGNPKNYRLTTGWIKDLQNRSQGIKPKDERAAAAAATAAIVPPPNQDPRNFRVRDW